MRTTLALLLLSLAACDVRTGRSVSVGSGRITNEVHATYGTLDRQPVYVILYHGKRMPRESVDTGTETGPKATAFGRRLTFDDGKVLEYRAKVEAGTETLTLGGQLFDLEQGRVFRAVLRSGSFALEQLEVPVPDGRDMMSVLKRLVDSIPGLDEKLRDR